MSSQDERGNDPERAGAESPPDPAAHVEDPLLALRGSGRELWADEPADVYVTRLREGWSSSDRPD
jgi:hypothetical protein